MANFVESTTPDITEGVVAAFSSRVKAVVSATKTAILDVTFGDIGFCVDPTTPQQGAAGPYIRQSVNIQKQQLDTSGEPGEQSLDGLWIRSQSSWHRGAGINYYEPGTEKGTQYRFAESAGMDVWTPGQVTPLHRTTLTQASASPEVHVADAGSGRVAYLDASSVIAYYGGSRTLATPAAGHQGRYYFFGEPYFKVGWASPGVNTVGIWSGLRDMVIAHSASVEPRLWSVKDRLIVDHGGYLHEVPPQTATAIDLSLTTGTSVIFEPSQPTKWVAVLDGPSAIYAVSTSSIYRYGLKDGTGAGVELTPAIGVLDLPSGETVIAATSYMGRYLILSTTEGVRVCAIDNSGGLVMGQVTVPASVGTIRGFGMKGSMVYGAGANVPRYGTSGTGNLPGWGTGTGLVAINLGEVVDDGGLVFAWALDETANQTGTASSVIVTNDGLKHMAVNGLGVYRTDTQFEPGGYLALGRVRFNSMIQKVFHSFDLLGAIGTGALRVDVLNEADNVLHTVSMSSATGVFGTVALPKDSTHVYVRPVGYFTMPPTGTPPVLTLVQLRAAPSPRRLRQIRFPLRCLDREQDRNGNRFGYDGFALDRVRSLEDLQDTGVPVMVSDHRVGEQFTALIDDVTYIGPVAPDRAHDNWDGVVQVTCTVLD